jgi:UDP-GlcNAc:undecaprenyl-phosphate GlcNAc-1-phosphate transferase
MGPAALALALTVALAPMIRRVLAARHLIDYPTDRSSHDAPTVRGGGVAPATATLIALVVAPLDDHVGVALVLGVAGFGLLGLADDVWVVMPRPRLLAQAVIAVALLPTLLYGLHGSSAWRVVFTAGVAVWVVAFVNAFNFMDGINGIAAAQALVAGVAWYAVGHHEHIAALRVAGPIVAAAALGFAPFNFPRARMFLGDVGSYCFGACLAILVVVGLRAELPVEAVLAPVSLFLVDTGATLVRRVRRGSQWDSPHREHVYQRLVQEGWTHAATTSLVFAVVTVCSLLGAASLGSSTSLRIAADAVLVLVLTGYLAAPELWRARRTNRRNR